MSIESRSNQYGTVFEHWQIKEMLGQGSGGKTAVFRLSRNDSFKESCALKVINLIEERGRLEDLPDYRKREYLGALEECKNRATPEVKMMLDLRGSSNVVDYLDHKFVSWSGASSFGCDLLIRMELLTDLRSIIKKGKFFDEAEILKVGKNICAALVLCHENNILHRDIKPENIFVNKRGNYKLGDFGVSRLLSTAPMAMATTGIGTPEYAAPEQFTGKHDKRVDIYSLGLVLYELSNQNKLPFASSSYACQDDVVKRQNGVPLPAPSHASSALWSVIRKACAFNPAERYQTAQEFLDALCRLDSSNYPASTAYRSPIPMGNETVRASAHKPGEANQQNSSTSGWSGSYETAPAQSAGNPPGGYKTIPAQPSSATRGIANKKSSKKWIAIIAAVSVLLIVGFFALSGIFKTDGEPNGEDEQRSISTYLSEAKEKADEGAYEDALDIIEDGLEVYPDSKELRNKSNEYSTLINGETDGPSVPETTLPPTVLLSTLNVLDSSGCTYWNAGAPVDPFGNSYANKSNFIIFDSSQRMDWKSSFHTYNAYAEYRVDGKAETINGWVVPYSTCKDGATAYIQVYADDVLLYTSPYVTRKSDPFFFEVDIVGAKYIKLCVVLENDGSNYWHGEYSFYSSLILYDVQLTTATAPPETPPDTLPTSLAQLTALNSCAWPEWNDGYPKDSIGSDYSTAMNYLILESARDMDFRGYDHTYTAFAEYRTNNEYSSLSGTIAPYTTAKIDATGYVQIYTDDVLAYTSPKLDGNTDPIPFTVDLGGVKTVKIFVVLENDGSYYWSGQYGYYSALILSDMKLHSAKENQAGYEESAEKSLSALAPHNNSAWPEWSNGFPQDLMQSDYSAAKNYIIFESERDMDYRGDDHAYTAFAEYCVNGEYSSLKGIIAPYASANLDANGYIQVYADENLVYISPSLDKNTVTIPFEVDLIGVNIVKVVIVLHNDGSNYWSGQYDHYFALMLSDVILKP